VHNPELINHYAVLWTLVNLVLLLVPIALLIGLVWYVRQRLAFQRNVLDRMDHLITLLEKDNSQL
jgi:hypothetical protein